MRSFHVTALMMSSGFHQSHEDERYQLIEKAIKQTTGQLSLLSKLWKVLVSPFVFLLLSLSLFCIRLFIFFPGFDAV